MKLRVGSVPGTGLRGTIATEDIPAGEVALAVPAGLCVQLGDAASQGAVRHWPCSKRQAEAEPRTTHRPVAVAPVVTDVLLATCRRSWLWMCCDCASATRSGPPS